MGDSCMMQLILNGTGRLIQGVIISEVVIFTDICFLVRMWEGDLALRRDWTWLGEVWQAQGSCLLQKKKAVRSRYMK